MGKIYNIALNSDLGAGANTNSKSYYFDWGRIPEGQYILSFTLQTSVVNIGAVQQPLIFIDFGTGSNNFMVGSDRTAYNSNFLGVIQPVQISATSFYLANTTNNTPTYIDFRPTKNNFIVDILTTGLVPFTTSAIPRYVLVLNFELLD